MVGDALGEQSVILDGRYRLERVLGKGAFGRVYLAYDSRLQRTVAIKELLATRTTTGPQDFAQYVARFEREARAAGSVFDANIVNVFELAIDTENNYYLIMEYVERGNLRDLLERVKTLPVERALGIAVDIARALEAIHEMDIVHRDLKPANIMLTNRGVAKLTDFGVAQLSHESQRTQISIGHPGTPLYMSPEQRQNADYLDGRSDLYSLGLVLYEMLTGEQFSRRKQPLEALRPDLSGAVVQIFSRLTEREPDRRYQTAEEVVADLQAAQASESRDTGTGPAPSADAVRDDRARTLDIALDPPGLLTTERRSTAGTLPSSANALQRTDPVASTKGGASFPGAPVPQTLPTRSRLPVVVSIIGLLVVLVAATSGLLVLHGGKQGSGQPTVAPTTGIDSPRALLTTVTALVGADLSPTPGAASTLVPNTPTVMPAPSTATTPPTVRPSATTRPNFQAVTNQVYAISFAYPKAWQRSDDETDQDTIFAFRMSPSAPFLVAKEDNPTATTLGAYIDEEIAVETTRRSGWKVGPRAHQLTMLGGQSAEIADFVVPSPAGEVYHYYVFTLRPKRAWGLLFSMPLSDFGKYQPDIDDVVRSFIFCTGDVCPPQSARLPAFAVAWNTWWPIGELTGVLPRRRMVP